MKKISEKKLKKYLPMIERFMQKIILRKWGIKSYKSHGRESIGNSGWTVEDIRQHLIIEVLTALQKYNPHILGLNNKSAKESTFIYLHLNRKTLDLLKLMTRKKRGYGFKDVSLEDLFLENRKELIYGNSEES